MLMNTRTADPPTKRTPTKTLSSITVIMKRLPPLCSLRQIAAVQAAGPNASVITIAEGTIRQVKHWSLGSVLGVISNVIELAIAG